MFKLSLQPSSSPVRLPLRALQLTVALATADLTARPISDEIPAGPTALTTNSPDLHRQEAANIFGIDRRDPQSFGWIQKYSKQLESIYLSQEPDSVRRSQIEDILFNLISDSNFSLSFRARIIEHLSLKKPERLEKLPPGRGNDREALSLILSSFKNTPSEPEEKKLLQCAINAIRGNDDSNPYEIVNSYALAYFLRRSQLPTELSGLLEHVAIPSGASGLLSDDPLRTLVFEFGGRPELMQLFSALGRRMVHPESQNDLLRRSLFITHLPASPAPDRNAIAWICRTDPFSDQPKAAAIGIPDLESNAHIIKAAWFTMNDPEARAIILADLKPPFTIQQLNAKLATWDPQKIERASKNLPPGSFLPTLRLQCMHEQLTLLASAESDNGGAFGEAVEITGKRFKNARLNAAFNSLWGLKFSDSFDSAREYWRLIGSLPPPIAREHDIARSLSSVALNHFGLSGSTNQLSVPLSVPYSSLPPERTFRLLIVAPDYALNGGGVSRNPAAVTVDAQLRKLLKIIRGHETQELKRFLEGL